MTMTLTTAEELGRPTSRDAGRLPLTECLLSMGPVLHRLDYGGRVALIGCQPAEATALLAAAYPLATVDAVDADAAAVQAATRSLRHCAARARCELDVGGPGDLPHGAYDLVCFPHGLGERSDPVADAAAALRALRSSGALMVVEHSRCDSFLDGPVVVGGWLLGAGAARVRVTAATTHGFVLDARATH